MEFELKTAQAKVYFNLYDQDRNLLGQVEKAVEFNHEQKPVVKLQLKDIVPGSKYFQLITEIDGQKEEHQLLQVDMKESVPVSKKDKGITLVGISPGSPYTPGQAASLGEVYTYIVKRAQEPRNKGSVDESEFWESLAAYEGMSYEERLQNVYERWERGELSFLDMSEAERFYWEQAYDRQSQETDHLLWNYEHHSYFLKRVNQIKQYLTDEENKAIQDLLQAKRWGDKELEEVKKIIETASWFNALEAKAQKKDAD